MNELINEEFLLINKPNPKLKLAYCDLLDTLSKWQLWFYLGWNDIKVRYRGSVLGPFWITTSMIIFICAFSLVYSRLFHQPLNEYIPFLTAGYLTWILISTVIIESSSIYIDSASFITEIKLPYTIYIFRLVWRNIIIFLHNILVFFAVALFFKIPIHWSLILIIPGLILVILNLISIAMIISLLGTKYRDIAQLIISLVQITFFITPISWSPNLIGHSIITTCNPIYYLIELIRAPLLGQVPTLMTWGISVLVSLFVFTSTFVLFARLRRNIPFWL